MPTMIRANVEIDARQQVTTSTATAQTVTDEFIENYEGAAGFMLSLGGIEMAAYDEDTGAQVVASISPDRKTVSVAVFLADG
jgi:hypothetical protein